jgi:hypothetical protein
MRRCQALMFACRVDQFYPDIIGCLPMASLRRLTSGISAHSAGGSKRRLQRLSVCAKELRNVRFRGVKRTSAAGASMSANDPERTLAACDQGHSAKAAI